MSKERAQPPPVSHWQVAQLRFTAFSVTKIDGSPEEWWRAVAGVPVDSVLARPKSGQHQTEGSFQGRTLMLQIQPDRVDWLLSPAGNVPVAESIEELPEMVPSAGALPEALAIFRPVASSWLKLAPAVSRLAFGTHLIRPVDDRKAGYLEVAKYLKPYVTLDPESSDFSYQINRQRPSKTGIANLSINRLTKWSVMLARRIHMRPSKDKGFETQGVLHEESAVRLELDINTNPEFDGELPRESLPMILDELIELGEEIAAKGDIK